MTQAQMGHNNPPSDIELLKARLSDDHTDITDRAKALYEASNRVPNVISGDDQAKKVVDFIKQINVCEKALEDARKEEKQPFLDAGKAVQDFFVKFKGELVMAKAKASKPLSEYTHKKQEQEREQRRKEEEKARQEAEETRAQAEKLAEAGLQKEAEKVAKKAERVEAKAERHSEAAETGKGLGVTRGNEASVSTRTVVTGEVVDMQEVDLSALREHLTPADLQKALNKFIKAGGRELKGAVIKEEKQAVVK